MPQKPQDDPPNLAEVRLRESVRNELLDELQDRDEAISSQDRRVFALALSIVFALGIILPLAGAVIGLAVRAFRWAAGW